MRRERQRHSIGKSEEFAVGRMKLIRIGTRDIGVIRLQSGELRAVMNRCPHKGAPICQGIIGGVWDSPGPGELTFEATRQVLVCPWHGFEYDLKTGREVCWKGAGSLRMYPIEDEGGEVVVAL
jgi:3-phenylpropionate/trans-cinnamate dioxygenase ferredoxin subunit